MNIFYKPSLDSIYGFMPPACNNICDSVPHNMLKGHLFTKFSRMNKATPIIFIICLILTIALAIEVSLKHPKLGTTVFS